MNSTESLEDAKTSLDPEETVLRNVSPGLLTPEGEPFRISTIGELGIRRCPTLMPYGVYSIDAA